MDINSADLKGLTLKEQDAARLVLLMEEFLGKPWISLKEKARFLTGLYTSLELQELRLRSQIRDLLSEQMERGTVSFAEVARTVSSSKTTVQRVWQAMRDEYPAVASNRDEAQIALPKETRAFDMVEELFAKAGFQVTRTGETGQLSDMQNGIAPFPVRFLRGDDVVAYLKGGVVDIACCGNDKIRETLAEERRKQMREAKVTTLVQLKDNPFRLSFAVPKEMQQQAEQQGPAFLQGGVIATKYDNLTELWLDENNIQAKVLKIKTGIEQAPVNFGARAIMDVVETGRSLKENGLVQFGEPILTGDISLFALSELYEDRHAMSGAKREQIALLNWRLHKNLENV